MSNRAAIVAEAMAWLGTPYHHCAGVRTSGVDCAMLLVRVYQACGLTPLEFDPRPYSTQWHLHRSEELYLQWLAVANAVPTTTPQAGDVAIWRFGRTYSHAGILINSTEVVHALRESGSVTIHKLTDTPLAGRDVKFYSVFKE
jgi:cell wall-associated NlpC family hydrolase